MNKYAYRNGIYQPEERGFTRPRFELHAPRGFTGTFREPFQNAFANAGAAVPWWDAGGWPAGDTHWVYQAKSGNGITVASLAASYVNLVNPGTNDLTVGVAPSWASGTGWTFSGTQYLITALFPAPDQSWSMIIQFSGVTNDGVLAGIGGGFTFRIRPFLGVRYEHGVIGGLTVAPALASGNVAIAGDQAYRNGVAESGTIPGGGTSTSAILIGARGITGSPPALYIVGTEVAIIFSNKTLTSSQVSAKAAQMALI